MTQESYKCQTLSVRPLPPALQEISIRELNEVPDRLEDDLKALEEWLAKQPHLNVRKERQWLVAFLRTCKFSLQRTKEKLDYFYTLKTMAPDLLSIKDPLTPAVQRVFDRKILAASLKAPSEANIPVLLMCRSEFIDVSEVHLIDIYQATFMCLDVLLYIIDVATVTGQYTILDMKNYPLGLIKELTPTFMKKAITIFTKAYPNRIKGLYCLNVHPVYESIINLFKTFLSPKLLQRLKVFREDNFHQIYDDIPAHVFPKEYGGEAGTWDELVAESRTLLETHRDWLMEDEKYFSDETKRPGKPKTSAELLGIEGSFRKLIVD